jgi:hypothetical protein
MKQNGFLLAGKRGNDRGFYIVGRQSVRWVKLPPNEYTSWKAIQIQDIEGLAVYVKYTKSESFLTSEDESDRSQYAEKQLKSGRVLKLRAENIAKNDIYYKTAVKNDLSARVGDLLLAKFVAADVAELATEQLESKAQIEREWLIWQLEFSSKGSVDQITKTCAGEGLSKKLMDELRKIQPELKSAYEKIMVKKAQPAEKQEPGVR